MVATEMVAISSDHAACPSLQLALDATDLSREGRSTLVPMVRSALHAPAKKHSNRERTMKLVTTAFYGDALQLDVSDVAKLLLGEELNAGGLRIAYQRLPDTGCRCPSCRERLGTDPTSEKQP